MDITVPQLPEDVVMNILSRLPVKYLIQLKCICKPWRSLISDPHFARLQLAQSKKNSCHRSILFTSPLQTVDLEAFGDGHDYVGYLEYPVAMKKHQDRILEYPEAMKKHQDRILEYPEAMKKHLDRQVKVRGSCNGLVCVSFPGGSIYLWNPTIREARKLPSTGNFLCYIWGLGYDSSVDDYKLVRARYRSHYGDGSKDFLVDFEILQLKKNVLCKAEEPKSDYLFATVPQTGIFLCGALHWLVKRPQTKIFVILAFNLEEEKFYELVELPDGIEETELYYPEFTGSKDGLFMFGEDPEGHVLEAWHLKEYGVKSSWTKIFSKKCTIPELGVWGPSLYYTKSGKIILYHGTDALALYDPKENTCKTVTLPIVPEWFIDVIYVESLILPDWYRPTNASTINEETFEGVRA